MDYGVCHFSIVTFLCKKFTTLRKYSYLGAHEADLIRPIGIYKLSKSQFNIWSFIELVANRRCQQHSSFQHMHIPMNIDFV